MTHFAISARCILLFPDLFTSFTNTLKIYLACGVIPSYLFTVMYHVSNMDHLCKITISLRWFQIFDFQWTSFIQFFLKRPTWQNDTFRNIRQVFTFISGFFCLFYEHIKTISRLWKVIPDYLFTVMYHVSQNDDRSFVQDKAFLRVISNIGFWMNFFY